MKFCIQIFVILALVTASFQLYSYDRTQKIERRLKKQEEQTQKRYEIKRQALEKKYQQKLKRLEKRKEKLSQDRYETNLHRIEKWHKHELKQIEYEEKDITKKMDTKKQKLNSGTRSPSQ